MRWSTEFNRFLEGFSISGIAVFYVIMVMATWHDPEFSCCGCGHCFKIRNLELAGLFPWPSVSAGVMLSGVKCFPFVLI